MNIKGHSFGKGTPVVCVPVVEKTAEGILQIIGRMTEARVEMIEWRMDWFEEVQSKTAVLSLLEQIKPLVENTVFLCTFRSKAQGGEGSLTEEEYLSLNRLAAESGAVDLVDVEFYGLPDGRARQQMIRQLQAAGVRVICSNHNFQETPTGAEMNRQLSEMVLAGADFAKLAVMPERKNDVLRLMEAVLAVKEQYKDSHLIAMSMGKDGVVSRLLGEWFCSEVTFAAFGKASAPGQIDYEDAKQLLAQLEECFT